MNKNEDFVNVSIRIKPIPKEETQTSNLHLISKNPGVLLVVDRQQIYQFDNVFNEDDDQEIIYNETVKHLVENVKNGYNSTIFAYGQTGTGKTYTMGIHPEDPFNSNPGILIRALDDFFQTKFTEDTEITINMSFIEIHNDKVYDLLDKDNAQYPLPIKGFSVQCIKEVVLDKNEALNCLKNGIKNRHTAKTKQNSNSSRSHAVFTIYYNVKYRDGEIHSKLNFVDLAGSESVKKAETEGSTFQEGISINKGLLSIGQVVRAIVRNLNHVPYRQSIITTILKDSLDSGNFVSLIACVSSRSIDSSETVHSLEFAKFIKQIKIKPEVNQVIVQFKRDNAELFVNNRRRTPSKRLPNLDYCYTPLKKAKFVSPMRTIEETGCSNLNESSMSHISTASSIESIPVPYSDILKEYVSAMEESLMTKLTAVIENTVTKSRQQPKTPELFDKIRKEINSVKKQILQFTAKSSIGATSSPILKDNVIGRVLDFNMDLENETNNESKVNVDDKEIDQDPQSPSRRSLSQKNIFKVPQRPIRKVNKCECVCPVLGKENILNETIVKKELIGGRKSERQCYPRRPEVENSPVIIQEQNKRRSSLRLQLKTQCVPRRHEVEDRPVIIQEQNKRRSSLRLQLKSQSKDSPTTKRTALVLKILNEGTDKDLQKLQTIGPKTANRIILFREVKGNFKDISDLAEMPQWTKTKYNNFIVQNYLKK